MHRNSSRLIAAAFMLIGVGLPLAPTFGQNAEPRRLKILSLKYCSAEEAARILSEVYPNVTMVTSALPSTNQLIIRGTPADLTMAQGLIEELDQKRAAPPATATSSDATDLPSSAARFPTPLSDPAAEPNYLSLAWEQNAREAAAKLREMLKKFGGNHPVVVRQRQALEELVRSEFERRQQLHAVRLQQLEEKLTRLKTRIRQQRDHQEQLIQQRVDQLTEGDVNATIAFSPSAVAHYIPLRASNAEPPTELATSLALLERVIESRQRIHNAESNYRISLAHLEQVKTSLDTTQETEDPPDEGTKDQLMAEIRVHEARMAAAKAELATAQKLLEILTLRVDAQKQLLQNSVEQAFVAARDAQREFERYNKLRKNNAVSDSEFDNKKTALEQARLKLDRAKTVLDAFEKSSK